ncbi:MAG: C40 family peptidase [Flavobacteriia bacterium]|nr:C40 family peptidase [Flavobacteriia bacterium]
MSNFLRAQTPASSDSVFVLEPRSIISYDDTVVMKNSKQVDEIISFAKTFLGTPYHYAGSSPSGFDCSGFIYYVMGNFGMTLTHSSYGMAEFGETVMLSELKPGDLMFFKGRNVNSTQVGHVSMVIEVTPDAIMFIHSSTSRGVVIENFKTSRYFIPRFLKAKRLDFGVEEVKN